MAHYRRPGKKDWLITLFFLAVYVAVLGLTAFCLLLTYWYVWLALAVAGLVILVSWHAKATAYRCPKCGYRFEISILADFLSPHGIDKNGSWKYLKCPKCSSRSRMEVLVGKRQNSS